MTKRLRDFENEMEPASTKLKLEDTLEKEFEWRTILNDLKSTRYLVEMAEFDQPEVARNLEIQIMNYMTTLPIPIQQRLKDLSFVRANIRPESMSLQTFDDLKQEIFLRSKTGKDLYDHVSNEIHDPLQKFRWMLVAAEKGYAEAQVFVAWCYDEEKCSCEQNFVKAAYWYTKSAKQGNVEALYQLMENYKDVPKSEEEANTLFRTTMDAYRAILYEPTHVVAQMEYDLAHCYRGGYGTVRDHKKSHELFILAANKGHSKAQYRLAACYNEKKPNSNLSNAKDVLEWLYKATLQKDVISDAYELLAYFLEHEHYGTPQFEECMKWRMIAAEKGNAIALYNLGKMYLRGKTTNIVDKKNDTSNVDVKNDTTNVVMVVEKDEKKAIEFFIKAAQAGDLDACYKLGYELNDKTTKMCSKKEQLEWITWAANRGHPASQRVLGLYLERNGSNMPEAIQFYLKAANRGNKRVCHLIGRYHRDYDIDIKKAMKWFTMGANAKMKYCQYALGRIYYNGFSPDEDEEEDDDDENYVEIDKKLGRHWMTMAANNGLPIAKKWLSRRPNADDDDNDDNDNNNDAYGEY